MSHRDFKFTNDLVIENGDIAIVRNANATGQAIRDRLSTFMGEWFLDLFFGPDYRDKILVKNPRLDVVSAIIKDEILKSVAGTFTDFDATINTTTRKLTLSYTIQTTDEVISDIITI